MSEIDVQRTEKVCVCDMCGKEITEGINTTKYVYNGKDFCCNICLSYYQYPTREDYLKGIREGK